MSINGEKFKFAFNLCMKLEGGGKYHEIAGDTGGATKYGISLRYLKSIGEDIDNDGDVDWEDIFKLQENKAMQIAYDGFWFAELDEVYKPISAAVFCTCYNMGKANGVKLLQQACNNLGGNLKIDGGMGSKTVAETKKHSEKSLLIEYCNAMLDRYINICQSNPSQYKFIRGWKNRTFRYLKLI